MNNFVFQNTTKIYFGKEQLSHLAEEIKSYGSRVLLTYGGGSIKRIGLYDRVMNVLKEAGVTVFELSGIEPNPRHTTVNKGADICKKEGIERGKMTFTRAGATWHVTEKDHLSISSMGMFGG